MNKLEMKMRTNFQKNSNYNLYQPLQKRNGLKQPSFNGLGIKQLPDSFKELTSSQKKELSIASLAFVSAVVCAASYAVGGIGLWYDHLADKKNGKQQPLSENNSNNTFSRLNKYNNPIQNNALSLYTSLNKTKEEGHSSGEGVKTIVPSTKVGKVALNAAKTAVMASSLSGITAGVTMGIPLMTVGETINIAAAPIVETPIGTGLFGIGIASVFGGLALENNPELKLNKFKLRAKESLGEKSAYVLKNMTDSAKEVGSSCVTLVQKTLGLFGNKRNDCINFFKDNIFSMKPKSVVIQEILDKSGNISVRTALRQPKNYLMNAASLVLTVGGIGLVAASLLNQKKAQKVGLDVEEGGFLADNLGMTRFGLDKLSIADNASSRAAGSGYALGGVVNAISQFIGIDNKDGRAAQWLGIAAVFLGFSIDRGKSLKHIVKEIKNPKTVESMVRQWHVDLTKIFNKDELNGVIKTLKKGEKLPDNNTLKKIENVFNDKLAGKNFITKTDDAEKAIKDGLSTLVNKKEKGLSAEIVSNINFRKDGFWQESDFPLVYKALTGKTVIG
jgi:hypothetical protein